MTKRVAITAMVVNSHVKDLSWRAEEREEKKKRRVAHPLGTRAD
jgi:hypothetical protein